MKFQPDYSSRVYGLDVMRAIAILLVVHVHGSYMLNGSFLDGFPWIRILDGVELFFVLSGFLIGGILIKILDKADYKLKFSHITEFWKRRWYRTLPNYFLVLLLNYLFVKFAIIDGDLNQFGIKFFLFLQNFSSPLTGFFWESWSLSIEEWFYLILPVCILILTKFLPNRKGLLLSIFILMLAPLLYRIIQSSQQVDLFWWDVKFRKVILTRLDTIIYGVLAAYIRFYHFDFWRKYALHFFVLGLMIVFGLVYLPILPNDFFTKTFYFNIASIGVMFLLPLADKKENFNSFFGKIITHISLISYSMYLVNLALVSQVIGKNFPIQNTLDGYLKYLIYWIVVLLFSSLLYFFFEKPMMNLRDKNWREKSI